MPSYLELKDELVQISAVLGKFPEELQSQVYDLLITEFIGHKPQTGVGRPQKLPEQDKAPESKAGKEAKAAPANPSGEITKPRRSASKESYAIDRGLNLRGDGSIPSLKDFYEAKKPTGAKEFNAVAIYYLKKILGMPTVTLNHAYTCYAEIKQKPPTAFKQSFIDAKNKNGWLEFDESGNIEIPHRGTVFVEHDLPHPEKPKK